MAVRVAAEVGIGAEDVRAEVLPGDKRDVVAALQAGGRHVGTCGFIEPAKKDSIDTLLAAADLKQA